MPMFLRLFFANGPAPGSGSGSGSGTGDLFFNGVAVTFNGSTISYNP